MTKEMNVYEEPRAGLCCRVRSGLGAIIVFELLVNFLIISFGLYVSTHVNADRRCYSPFLFIFLNLIMTYLLHHGRNTENHWYLIPFMVWKLIRLVFTTLLNVYLWRNVHLFEQNLEDFRQYWPQEQAYGIGIAVLFTLFMLLEFYFLSIVSKGFSWYRFKSMSKEIEKEGLEVTYRVPVPTMPPAAPPPYIHVDKTDPEYKY